MPELIWNYVEDGFTTSKKYMEFPTRREMEEFKKRLEMTTGNTGALRFYDY